MTREEFRTAVFKRDNHTCVVPGCGQKAQDAHHIIERALWTNPEEEGGYIVDNGASVCGEHHIHTEKCFIPSQALRNWAGIKRIVLPKQLDPLNIYDKWGKIIPRPNRELVKYPHTPYMPFSPSADEKDISDCGYSDLSNLVDKPLVITIKMDGSNNLWTNEKVAARNAYDAPHKSFDLAKAEHAKVRHLIPNDIQIFGEWLYAKHSIHYQGPISLDGLYQLFGVYRKDQCLWESWDVVKEWAAKLGMITVPVIEFASYSSAQELEGKLTKIGWDVIKKGHEGIVVRSIYPYYWGDFSKNIAKFVRPHHVQTDKHWMEQPIVRNIVVK
jgi:hypothetical protein